MATQSNPAAFRANATARYQKIRARLIRLMIVTGGVGFLLGALVGFAIGSSTTNPEPPLGGFWFAGELIGLATGTVFSAAVAGIIWLFASLIYVMTQDGA